MSDFKTYIGIRSIFFATILSATSLLAAAQDGFVKGDPQLAYWKLGDKPETVIVLHGGPACHHKYLRPELDGLSENATLIYYDQRGCGKSDRGNTYTWQDHVKDLRRLIAALAPKQKIFLAGSSWGSLLAILYTYLYPENVKGIILTGTVRWLGEGKTYIANAKIGYNKPHTQPIKENRLVSSVQPDGTTRMDTVEISKLIEGESGIQHHEAFASLMSAPIADSLAKIRTPVIIFNGKRNLKYDWVDGYMRLFRNAELVTFEVGGHDPWFSDPALFATHCNRFILQHR